MFDSPSDLESCMENRVNKELETIVIKGLIAASTLELPELVTRMSGKGVPSHVIERVFIECGAHRATDIDTSVGVM
jgi:hypothetical protein